MSSDGSNTFLCQTLISHLLIGIFLQFRIGTCFHSSRISARSWHRAHWPYRPNFDTHETSHEAMSGMNTRCQSEAAAAFRSGPMWLCGGRGEEGISSRDDDAGRGRFSLRRAALDRSSLDKRFEVRESIQCTMLCFREALSFPSLRFGSHHVGSLAGSSFSDSRPNESRASRMLLGMSSPISSTAVTAHGERPPRVECRCGRVSNGQTTRFARLPTVAADVTQHHELVRALSDAMKLNRRYTVAALEGQYTWIYTYSRSTWDD
jgi:hypothetical protein